MKKLFASFSCVSKRQNSSDEDEFSPHLPIEEHHAERKKSSNFFKSFHQRIFQKKRRERYDNRSEASENIYEPIGQYNDVENSKWYNWKHTGDVTDENNFCHICKRRIPPQIIIKYSWARNETVEALASSPFSLLPHEIYLRICQYLSARELANVSLVCRQFKMIVDDDLIWKWKCQASKKLLSKSYKEIYMDWMYEKYVRNHQLKVFYDEHHGGYEPIFDLVFDVNDFNLRPYASRLSQIDLSSIVAKFPQHPNELQRMTIQLSVDLDKTIPEFICLLEKSSDFQNHWLEKPTIVRQMILRYYRFLQLKTRYPANVLLIPTLDIEIIWQTHLSRPEMYRNDCKRLFGQLIDHCLVLNHIEEFLKEKAFLDTCRLYEEHFEKKYCSLPLNIHNRKKIPKYTEISSGAGCQLIIESYSYWDESYFEFDDNIFEKYENPFSFNETDVIQNIQWFNSYKTFMYETRYKLNFSYERVLFSLNGKLNSSRILLMKKSYERFLYLAAKYPPHMNENDFLYPTYAIDLVGRCHQQEPVNYSVDCLKFVGYVLDYSRKTNRTNKMNEIWKSEFNCDFDIDHLYRTYDNNSNTLFDFILL